MAVEQTGIRLGRTPLLQPVDDRPRRPPETGETEAIRNQPALKPKSG